MAHYYVRKLNISLRASFSWTTKGTNRNFNELLLCHVNKPSMLEELPFKALLTYTQELVQKSPLSSNLKAFFRVESWKNHRIFLLKESLGSLRTKKRPTKKRTTQLSRLKWNRMVHRSVDRLLGPRGSSIMKRCRQIEKLWDSLLFHSFHFEMKIVLDHRTMIWGWEANWYNGRKLSSLEQVWSGEVLE